MIEQLSIRGYRSIRSLDLDLAPLTVVLGPNGVGKTNLYRGLELIQAAAAGGLSRALAGEGGMASALWAGDGWRDESERETAARARSAKGPVRLELSARIDHLAYALSVGLPNGISEPALPGDAVVREETVTAHAGGRKVTMMSRKGPALSARDDAGKMRTVMSDLLMSETALASVSEPAAFPELLALQREIGRWRFYHQFRADPGSPLRGPQAAITSPALDSDGGNWASVLYTRLYLESSMGSVKGDDVARSPITEAVGAAFPGAELGFETPGQRVEPLLRLPEFHRPFNGLELSDGQLRMLCLIAALTALRLPPFLALNEPETSLHPDMIVPLAHLIGHAAPRAQMLVVTHSAALAETLDLDYAAHVVRLTKDRGETVLED
ncbi:MAG: AAA family ATPase [Pseudomonadota bacterium]